MNRTMQDIRSNNQGLEFLFAGDFIQILPVVTKGTRAVHYFEDIVKNFI